MYIILTKENCPKCEQLKQKLAGLDNIQYVDSKSVDGMSLLAYHELFNEKTPFPFMITPNDEIHFSCIEIRKIITGHGDVDE